MSEQAQQLPEALRDWIARESGGAIEQVFRKPGGGRREAWVVDVRGDDGELRELFLRYDRTTPAPFDPYTLQREGSVYLALRDTEVPVPRVVAVHPDEQAILAERVEGDTWMYQLRDEQAHLAVAKDFMAHLATLHRLDVRELPLEQLGPVAGVREHIRRELDIWEGLYRNRALAEDPLAELGLAWLRRNIPDYDEPVVLVQGDTGPGNFLYKDGRVTAILDWELAHLGDPMDDLGWLALRATQDPFPDLATRMREYEQLSGHRLDLERIRYHRVFAELRVVILALGRNAVRNLRAEIGNGIIFEGLHRRLCVEALVEALGVSVEPPELIADEPDEDPAADEHAWLYESALTQLREIVAPSVEDAFASLRLKGVARILKYLRDVHRKGEAYAAAELADSAELLGERHEDVRAARTALSAAIRDGKVDDAAVLRHLSRQVTRETDLRQDAMGALADRHFDPLP